MKKVNYWIAGNAIAICLYLCLSFCTWPTFLQEDIPLEFRIVSGGGLLVKLICLLIFLMYLAINFIWLIMMLVSIRHWKLFLSLLTWLLVSVLWIASFRYDTYRSLHESPRLQEIRKHEPDWGK